MPDSDPPTPGDRLLRLFDSDSAIAAEKLLRAKNKLILRFTVERCHDPESLANDAIARLLCVIEKNPDRVITSIGAFLFGIATNIIHESRRSPIVNEVPLDEMAPSHEPRTSRLDDVLVALSEEESLHICLKQCLDSFDASDRELLIHYYDADNDEQLKSVRKRIALRLGLTSYQLRKRAFNLRKKLEASIKDCLADRNKTHKSS
jgi:DNA-directed RNA polymerase specialized sigma24 family protein